MDLKSIRASLVAQPEKNPFAITLQVQSLYREDLLRREWLPTSVFLPGEFHGQGSLADYSLWGCKELDTTEQLSTYKGCYTK